MPRSSRIKWNPMTSGKVNWAIAISWLAWQPWLNVPIESSTFSYCGRSIQ